MVFLFALSSLALGDEEARRASLDEFWSDVSEAVKSGDFEAYRAAHHPDGVLVMNGQSLTLESAHKGFQSGFEHTASGVVEAGIEFRWTHRSGGTGTAVEKGGFKYWSRANAEAPAGGSDYTQFTRIEVILVEGEMGWRILVQTQGEALTREQWDALE